MLKPLAKRWEVFGTSIFSVMSARARELGAVNLSQGFPDFDGPERIKEAAQEAMAKGENQYAPSIGIPPLRAAISKRLEERYGIRYHADEQVTITSGATEALFCAFQALCNPGDEVLTFAPYYDSYPACAVAAGARLVSIPLVPPAWRWSASQLALAVTPSTKAILLNTPHNPTGRVFSLEELEEIADLARRHNLYVITDEVYDELYFSDARHRSIATLKGMQERTIVISSTAKSFSLTGWKIGYVAAPPEITSAIRRVHQFTVFCSATPLQWGALAAFSLPEQYFRDLRSQLQDKRDYLLQALSVAGFRCSIPEGTYFIVADFSAIRGGNDLDFVEWLVSAKKLAAIPLSVFYDNPQVAEHHWVRFASCKQGSTLQAAAAKLADISRASD